MAFGSLNNVTLSHIIPKIETIIVSMNSDPLNSDATQKQGDVYPWAVAGLILSVLCPPVGLILSVMSLVTIKKNKLNGEYFAITGICVGFILSLPILFYLGLLLLIQNSHFVIY